jgi:DNA-binding YbaB/EbfC family protein
MKQAQQMQTRMAEMQAKLSEIEMSGQSGGGMVTAVMNGKGELRKITLDKAAVDPEDVEILEDLIIAAIADAKNKIETHVAAETQKLMGGMQLPPGMKLPF